MNNKDIANTLQEIAVLLELKGENSFKVRAFENASRTLKSLELSTTEFIKKLKGNGVKGFGPQLTEYILTLHETEELPYHNELRSEFPESLLEFLKIPGLGAKKVKALYEDLQLSTLAQLKDACEKNNVSALKGFGKKTEQNILEAIDRYETYSTLYRIDVAEEEAKKILLALTETGLADKIEIAGSLRRKKEIVKDIDIVASTHSPEELSNAFVQLPDIHSVTSHGPTKSSIVLTSGISVDLRVVSPKQFPSALLHFTGSKEHNTRLRTLSKQKDLKLNEYGLHKDDKPLELKSEAEIYAALDLTYTPPELREDRGEVDEAAEGQGFRDLVELDDIQGVLHAHSTYSDGSNTLQELATAVKKRGYSYLGISDHSKTAVYAGGLREDDIKRQHEEIETLNTKLAPFKIYKGIESDILGDGSLDYTQEILESFDFVIASIHSRLKMDEDEMTQRIIKAIENPCTTFIGHLSGRILLRRDPYTVNIDAIFEAAQKNNVALEINASPKRLDLDWRFHRRAKQHGIRMPICPDAHSISGVDNIYFGVCAARKGGLSKEDIPSCWNQEQIEKFFKKEA